MTRTYLYYSGHGDLAAEADGAGTRSALHTYDPFGAPTDTQPSDTTVHRYTGRWAKQYDTSSGLILMGARPYDPSLGRFLAVDPIDGGSLNNYDYVGQDPTNRTDLTGQASGTGCVLACIMAYTIVLEAVKDECTKCHQTRDPFWCFLCSHSSSEAAGATVGFVACIAKCTGSGREPAPIPGPGPTPTPQPIPIPPVPVSPTPLPPIGIPIPLASITHRSTCAHG